MKAQQQVLKDLLSIDKLNRDRVLIVGPVQPYRGGIAQHTTMLHRALREQTDCLTISFSRQYPSWIFPGQNDKDENLAGHQEPSVEYVIDSINPLSWMRAVKRIRQFAPRMVIFPWWHVYWAPCFTWIIKQLKKDNIKIVFFCHNAVEHEDARWKHRLADFVLSNANRFVVHTSIDKESLVKRLPDIPVSVHPHPIYDQFPQPTKKLPRRAKLELLFFGFVRPYKGLDVLLEAMTLLKEEDVFLSIVGEFWHGEGEALEYVANNGIEKKVEIVARYVSDDEAASYFSRCDVVVLPYHSATGSGVIPLAYHYDKPVIATRVGGLTEVVIDGVTGSMIDPDSSLQLVQVILGMSSHVISYDTNKILELKRRLTWRSLAETVICFDGDNKTNINHTERPFVRTHAILDVHTRENKAKKIVALTRRYGKASFRNVLEVGTGSGFIASYFSQMSEAPVHAVDIVDERRTTEGVLFQLVQGTKLPFVDEMFDFIISNHVVEHVGGSEDQVHHLKEIFRCLEPGGMLYLAVPNRWRLIEPHYKLPFLSWFPKKLSSGFVRLLKIGSQYDCQPLSRQEAANLLSCRGFECIDITLDAIPVMGEIEGGYWIRFLTLLPKGFWRLFTMIMPTHIFLCRKPLI